MLPFRALALLALGGFTGCSVDDVDLSGKHCPCAAGWTCDESTDRCVRPGASGGAGGVAGSGGGTAGSGGTQNSICQSATENTALTLTCPSGTVVTGISFASYGTPGTCDDPKTGDCDASSSKSVTECYCLGRASCTVEATNGNFGDPCVGIGKSLLVVASCGAASDAGAGGSGGSCAVGTGGAGATGGTGGTGATGGTGGTGATGGTGGAGAAGGTGATGGAGGSASGSVTCGGSECSLNGSLCCIDSAKTCQPESTPCTGTAIKCDGPEDCAGGLVCCAKVLGTKLDEMGCVAASLCNATDLVCGTTPGVCVSGLSCKPLTKFPEYSLCQ
ncbi:MAG: hypothetical protein IT377_29975 [Polyangiaceae bacterium]|nr:hypothetical protein [Polyangiaceae bacterium]